jgi:hypothetical protein
MKISIAIVVTALMFVIVGGALAAMNNACKSTQHLGAARTSARGITLTEPS